MSAGLELNIANPIVLPFQSVGMSMMCPPCPEVLEHFAFGTHTALFITIVNNYSVGFQMQKRKYFVFWTFTHSPQPGRGNLFDILRNQAFSLRQRLFSGKILRRRKSSVGQFWSRVWTGEHSSGVDKMTQMCLSVPIRVRCGPFCSRY